MTQQPSDGARGVTLRRNAIGLSGAVFQSVTEMGPAVAIASSLPFAIGFAGGSALLSVLLAMVGALLVASCIGQLAKHLPSAGSFYTYASNGLHPAVGYLVAWAFALAQFMVNPLLYAFIGLTVAGTMSSEFGWPASTWWVWAVACALVVALIGYAGVKVSARVGILLGGLEIAVFSLLAVWLIVTAGHANTLSVFTLQHATAPGYVGFSGVFAGSVFTVLAFAGFESAAVLAEEAQSPTQNIKRAVLLSVLIVGTLYLLSTYAATVFFGPAKMAAFGSFNAGNPWDALARSVWGVGWVVVFLAIVNSTLANANAGSNATTRTWFAMGRIRLLPAPLAALHPRHRSPYIAQLVQLVLGVGVTLWLCNQYGPLTTVLLSGTVITVVFVPMYMIINLSCIGYYLRYRRAEFNVLLHLIIPVLGIVAFVPAFLSGAGIRAFKFISQLPAPLSYAGIAVAIWMAVGVILGSYFWLRHPERLRETGRIFLPDAEAVEPVRVPEA